MMSRNLKIAIVTQYYAPDLPSWTPTGLARELAARGHDVRVLTTFPHYRTGRVSDGYRQRWDFSEQDGSIEVKRVPMIASHSSNALGRMLNYLSFSVTSRVLGRSFVRGADVVYVYATPMTVAEGPRAWTRSLRVPYVLHVQDLWPESMTGSGFLPAPLARLAERLMNPWLRQVYAKAAASIAIAPTMKQILTSRGVAHEKVQVVLNWSNEFDDISANGPTDVGGDAKVTIVYAGNLGQLQDLETVVRAAATVRDLTDVLFRIAGSGVMRGRLEQLALSLGATNIEFLGQLTSHEMIAFYDAADFQLVTLRNMDVFRGIIPSKLTSGLANGVPAISTVIGDTGELIRQSKIGFTAEPESVDALASAIRQAASTTPAARLEYRARARAHYREHMSKTQAIDRIEELLRSVAERTER